MAELLGGTGVLAVTLVLLGASAGHIRRPHALTVALREHRTLPGLLIRPVAAAVPLAEGILGLLGGYAAITGRTGMLRGALLSSAVLLAGYAAYSAYVVRNRPAVPCGCGGPSVPMSVWVPARAAGFSLLAAAGAAWADDALAGGGAHLTVTALIAATFTVSLWALPVAMAQPGRTSAP